MISISRATRSDVPAIAGMAVSLHGATRSYLPSGRFRAVPNLGLKCRNHYRKAMQQKDAAVFKAVEGGNAVGFLECRLAPKSPFRPQRYVELQALFVKPEFRKEGAGSMLFGAMFAWAKRKKARETELSCWSENAPAMNFYESQGFKEYRKVMKRFL